MNRRFRQLVHLAAVALAISTLAITTVAIGPASAEDPDFIAEEVSEDGVYVAPGRSDVDEAELEAVVQSLRFKALRVVVVAPRDPQPSSEAFARRVQEATDADVSIVFPPLSDEESADQRVQAFVIDDLRENHFRALAQAREFSDPARSVEAYGQEIQATRESERPAIIGQLLWAVALMAIGIFVIFGMERAIARVRSKPSASSQSASSDPSDQSQAAKVATASSEAR